MSKNYLTFIGVFFYSSNNKFVSSNITGGPRPSAKSPSWLEARERDKKGERACDSEMKKNTKLERKVGNDGGL